MTDDERALLKLLAIHAKAHLLQMHDMASPASKLKVGVMIGCLKTAMDKVFPPA